MKGLSFCVDSLRIAQPFCNPWALEFGLIDESTNSVDFTMHSESVGDEITKA